MIAPLETVSELHQSVLKVTGQKARLFIAAASGVLVAFLLVGLTYIVFPERNTMPIPMPMPSVSVQIYMAIYWLVIAIIIAVLIVGTAVLIGKIRSKRSKIQEF